MSPAPLLETARLRADGPRPTHRAARRAQVSNHASWFDIPLVAQILLSQNFKFIAADELRGLPLVGQQLVDGKHVLIDRSTRRGQLRSYKESVAYLEEGIGIFAFPEGTRSRTGRMMDFKGGVFSMAMKAGVPLTLTRTRTLTLTLALTLTLTL